VPDIFDEVAEDLRAERAQKLLRRYGGLLIIAAVLVIAGVGGHEIWKRYQAGEIARQAALFLEAQKIAAGPIAGRSAAVPVLENLARDGSAGYRALSRLRAAAIKAEAGDHASAAQLWNAVANDGDADPLLRDLATLQWATHQIDAGEAGAVDLRLAPLLAAGNPFRPMAEEIRALMALRLGKLDAAREGFKRLAVDTAAPDGVRGRANGLLQRLGGGA